MMGLHNTNNNHVEEKSKSNDDGASVVGDIKSSNRLFGLNHFASNDSTPIAKKKIENIEGIKFKGNIDKKYDVINIAVGSGGYLAAEEMATSNFKTLYCRKRVSMLDVFQQELF